MSFIALRHSRADAGLVGASIVYGAALLAVPSVPLIAIGFWWTANTVAHNFIHLPFFRERRANAVFSLYLTVLLGVPQTLWRDRHLAHHAGRPWRLRPSRRLAGEVVIVSSLWTMLATVSPGFFLMTYLPGLGLGLVLAQLQGHYEHAHGTTSHYGRLYNLLFFNDGYHAEHHASPRTHWSALPSRHDRAEVSPWPPVLRWIGQGVPQTTLSVLERVVVSSRHLQRFVLIVHRRAFASLLNTISPPKTVVVIGGGLFPRTVLVFRDLLPGASIAVMDDDARHLAIARERADESVRWIEATFEPGSTLAADLVVVPLALRGSRKRLYESPPARVTVVHDWIWRARGRSVVVSWLLLKRLNLIEKDLPVSVGR